MSHRTWLAIPLLAAALTACSPSSAEVPDAAATSSTAVADVAISTEPTDVGATNGGGCEFLFAFTERLDEAMADDAADPAAPAHDPLAFLVAVVEASEAALETAPADVRPEFEDLAELAGGILEASQAALDADDDRDPGMVGAATLQMELRFFVRRIGDLDRLFADWVRDHCTLQQKATLQLGR